MWSQDKLILKYIRILNIIWHIERIKKNFKNLIYIFEGFNEKDIISWN